MGGCRRRGLLVTVLAIGALGGGIACRSPLQDEVLVSVGGTTSPLSAVAFPIHLAADGDMVVLRIPQPGSAAYLALDLRLLGDVVVLRGTGHSGALDVTSTATGATCEPGGPSHDRLCRVLLHGSGSDLRVLISAGHRGLATISGIEVRRLWVARHVAVRWSVVPLVALLLVMLSVPATWLLQRHLSLSQWLLIGVGIAVLAAVELRFCALLLMFLTAAYLLGVRMRGSERQRLVALVVGGVAAISFLVAFKYERTGIAQTAAALWNVSPGLPLGLSYFVIRLVDTQLRWYRGELPDVGFREYLTYMLFPATLPAGPIETLDQFRERRIRTMRREDVAYGLQRIVLGAAKKVVLADFLLSRALFGSGWGLFEKVALSPSGAPFPTVASALSISFLLAYTDFSAYSDIAIGLGRLYGYRIRENFDWPIVAENLREFWRRWHMSLSSWCMRNLYFPLVLRKRSPYLPLYVVMITMGLWHEAGLSWLAWGLHHATGLTVLALLERHRILPATRSRARWGKPVRVACTLTFVIAGHSFVLLSDFGTAVQVYGSFWRGLFMGWLT